MTITYRVRNGSPLTWAQVDENFRYLDEGKVDARPGYALSQENFTATYKQILDGIPSNLDYRLTQAEDNASQAASDASAANTKASIVLAPDEAGKGPGAIPFDPELDYPSGSVGLAIKEGGASFQEYLASADGSSVVGYDGDVTYPAGSVGKQLKDEKRIRRISVFDYMTEAEVADVLSLSPVLDHTAAFQNAVNNNVTVEVPPFTFRISAITMDKFGHALVSTQSSGGQAYGGGAVIKGTDGASAMISVSKPTSYFSGIVFWGLSSDTEKGQDVSQIGIKFAGSAQKDIDAKVKNCSFIYVRSGVVANGTNIEFDSVGFSNCTYGFETSNDAGWENRGFIFSPTCRFHSIGKSGTDSAGVKLWPAHNVRDAVIAGVCDDSTTAFSGFASGLTIDVLMVRARGTGLSIDATGHGQPAGSRMVTVKHFSYQATDATNLSMANSGVIASGLMDLTLDQVHIRGCGGNGINSSVVSAKIKNSHVSDAGQFASNTYDGIYTSGAGSFLQSVSTSQDANGSAQTNKSRYGLNINADTYVSGCSAGLGTVSGPINVASTATLFGEIVAATGPASSETWASAMPTSGTYRAGSIVRNRTPSVSGTAPNQYVVAGWLRLTTGSAHVLGTDWVATRTLTGT